MDTVQVLLSISICALVGLLMSRVCKLLKLPAVTGYLIAGILVGCYCLGSITLPGGLVLGFDKLDHGLDIICSVALGFIAFSIGSEFKLSELKKTGKQATVIGILQALVTTVVCAVVLLILHFVLLKVTGEDILPIPAVLVLSAIGTLAGILALGWFFGYVSLSNVEILILICVSQFAYPVMSLLTKLFNKLEIK